MHDSVPVLVYVGIGLFCFMLPTIIACRNGHPHKFAIFIANIVVASTPPLWLAVLYAAMYGRRFSRRRR